MTKEKLPPCAVAMGCLCWAHANDADADDPCDASEPVATYKTRLRPYKPGDAGRVEDAIELLKQARTALVKAGATRAAEKVRVALKSAEGAKRHADRLLNQQAAR